MVIFFINYFLQISIKMEAQMKAKIILTVRYQFWNKIVSHKKNLRKTSKNWNHSFNTIYQDLEFYETFLNYSRSKSEFYFCLFSFSFSSLFREKEKEEDVFWKLLWSTGRFWYFSAINPCWNWTGLLLEIEQHLVQPFPSFQATMGITF